MSASFRSRGLGAIAALVVGLALASCGSDELETRTFRLRSLNPEQAEQLIRPYVFEEREGAEGEMSLSRNSISVREMPENLDRIQAVLEEYDRNASPLSLRFHLIHASDEPGSDEEIAEITEALRDVLRFPGYRLVGTSVLRVTPGEGSRQRIGGAAGEPYELNVHAVDLWGPPDSATVLVEVRLEDARGDVLWTRVSAPVGETVVIGSGQGSGPEGGTTVILAVSPEQEEVR